MRWAVAGEQIEHWCGVESQSAPPQGWVTGKGKPLRRARTPLEHPDTVGAVGRRPGWGCPGGGEGGGLAVSRMPQGRAAAGGRVHRGSLPKLLLLFLRLALEKGMSRDSRRKGRGWGISGAWVGDMAEVLLSGEPRPGGEL